LAASNTTLWGDELFVVYPNNRAARMNGYFGDQTPAYLYQTLTFNFCVLQAAAAGGVNKAKPAGN